jgi:hypothetical protein
MSNTSNSIHQNHKVTAQSEELVDKEEYQKLVGRLIYLCHRRPHIVYTVSVVSMYMHEPRSVHMEVAHIILMYFKGASGKGVWFKSNVHLSLEFWMTIDADCARGSNDQSQPHGTVLL